MSKVVAPRSRIFAIRLIYLLTSFFFLNLARRDYLAQDYLFAAIAVSIAAAGVVSLLTTLVPARFPKYGKRQRQIYLATDIDTAYTWMSTALNSLVRETELLLDPTNLAASTICPSTIRSLGEKVTGTVHPEVIGVTVTVQSQSIWPQMPDYGKNYDNVKFIEKAIHSMKMNSGT